MGNVILTAPLSGWIVPLGGIPDPAFAEGMVGAGAAIDPTDSLLRAPCDGEIVQVANAHHALTLAAGNGALILLHVGIDTVGLQGEGLTPRVAAGQRVRQGEPLLDIDLDRLVYRATSLITPIIVTNSDAFPVTVQATNCLVAAGGPFMTIGSANEAGENTLPRSSHPDAVMQTRVLLEHGLHARPAARIARLARQFAARTEVSANGRQADAASTVGLMALGVRYADTVELRGFGADAADAVRALAEAITSGLGEAPAGRPPRETAASARKKPGKLSAGELRGVVASRGFAVGVAQQLELAAIEVSEHGAGADFEAAELERARNSVGERLRVLIGNGDNDILGAQLEFLDDPVLLKDAHDAIRRGKSAGFGWQQAIRRAQDALLSVGDARLAERVADFRDVEVQVLQSLSGMEDAASVVLEDAAIVLARELLPSELSRLDLSKVAGFCTAGGGPTSHVALLAASMGIPAVVGAGPEVMKIPSGTRVLLDAEEGRLRVEPDAGQVETATAAMAESRRQRASHMQDAKVDCYTADGCRIEILANLASLAEARDAVAAGAEGCGLLRTEFLFQNRQAAPSEDEQAAAYQQFADVFDGRPLVIRTLDAGGDKPLAYLPLPREENPLLGLRGLRVGLRYPELLRTQLAAILRVDPAPARRVLLPMITEPGEIRTVRTLVEELADERGSSAIAVGAMIETPASVVLAEAMARESDFLSIGSNDLAQYTLATDRAHPELAVAFDSFHPAVLKQIAAVCKAAGPAGCGVSVCGALASDPRVAPILIGLGVRTLSVVPAVIPELKARIRQLSLTSCSELAHAALAEDDARSLRRLTGGSACAPRPKP